VPLVSQSTVRRVRRGSGVPLREAARRAGVPFPRLSDWETGERRPPPGVIHRVIEAVAVGAPRKGDRVAYLLSYDLLGRRWLTDGEQRVAVFAEADAAAKAADLLEADQFGDVKVTPMWPSAIGMIVPDRRRRVMVESDGEAEEVARACSARWLKLFPAAADEVGLA
jgi:transcriptional regulator with XRE-family HTH domain